VLSFRLGFGLRLLILQLDQGSCQALQVSWSPYTSDPDAAIFSMMIRSTH
jgi:hypothetical protein